MAAIDLERGLEHSGRGWGQERPELMDNFDSEMQEWEDQLQDIQRKIEEVNFHIEMLFSVSDPWRQDFPIHHLKITEFILHSLGQ